MSEQPALPTRDDEADAQAWFYLDHREDIEAWAALRTEAAGLVERYLLALASQLGDLATELGAEPYAEDLESGSWPRFGVRRNSWSHGGVADIAVLIEWERSRLLSPSRPWPYVGVRLDPAQQDPVRRQSVADVLLDFRRALGCQRSQTWPVWAYVNPPAQASGVDPEALATRAWTALRQYWDGTALLLDSLH